MIEVMKVLKCILLVYLGIIIVFLLVCFVLFPVILSEYFNNEKYLYLLLISIPILLGVIYYYSEPINYRPKR